jgi:hypothetical protein
VQQSARERLAALVDPAITTLGLLVRERKEKNVSFRGVHQVLNSNGLNEPEEPTETTLTRDQVRVFIQGAAALAAKFIPDPQRALEFAAGLRELGAAIAAKDDEPVRFTLDLGPRGRKFDQFPPPESVEVLDARTKELETEMYGAAVAEELDRIRRKAEADAAERKRTEGQ